MKRLLRSCACSHKGQFFINRGGLVGPQFKKDEGKIGLATYLDFERGNQSISLTTTL